MEVQESNAATSLSGIGGECIVMEVQEYNAATSHPATEGHSQVGFDEQLRKLIASDLLDFDSWTSLISETENTFPDNKETISLVYESFLSKFPLCHLYWKRYANHKTRLCSIEKAVEIFERAVQLAQHSVPLWVEYCSFSMYAFEDPFDIRWIFTRGISYVGKDYLCHTLWDKFIEFEYTQQQWSSIAHLFIQTLRFPTKKLHIYYKNFKKFATLMEKEMNCENNCSIEVNEEALVDDVVKTTEKEIYHVIKDLEDSLDSSTKSKALKKYISIGEQFYQKACRLNEKIHCFEDCIKRSFFHVKPLDDDQLAKWHQYLDFIEKQVDFEWAVKLYERCLITCANYPEFWMRYVEFTEANGGRELANFALERATQVFLKDLPVIHIFSARFKEKIGDLSGARAAYQFNAESSSYVENVIKEANMEKRLGNLESAFAVYEKALKMVAEKQKLHTVPVIYVHFSRLKYMITGSSDAAINVIIDGIQHIPHSRLLLEELIKFAMMHEGSKHLNKVDPIIANAISPGPDVSQGLGSKDREDLSCLYLEFVDLWGTNDDIRKAWNRHIKLFPHLIRTTSYNDPVLSNQSLSVVNEGTKKGLFFMLNQPSTQEQGLLSSENHAMNPDRVSADQLQPNNDNKGAPEGTQRLTHQVVVRLRDDEGASEPMELTHDSVHESQGDASGLPAGPIRFAEATQLEPEPEEDKELEKNLDLISVENLSLDSPEKESPVLNRMDSHEHDVPLETSASNVNMLSPNRSRAVDSAKLHNESDENESVVSPLSYEKLNHTNRDSGGARSGVHRHSQDPEQQQQQASPQQNQYQAGGAAKVNTITSGALAVENVPPGFSHPQGQMAQYPMQSGDQVGHIENSQAYNQMLQSYYQQQLMQQQYQQQLLQLQPYLQQQQHEQMMVQHPQYHQQGTTDLAQQQQYMLYMQQQQQYQQQQYQQQQAQQYQQQLGQPYNLQGEQGYQQVQMLQEQQQQIPLSYYQQGHGIAATVTASVAGPSESLKSQKQMITQPQPIVGAPRPSVSLHSRLQSPPACSAAGKSRTARSPSLGHPSQKKK